MIFRFGIKGRKWNAVFSFGNTKTQLVSALFFSYSFYFIEKYFMHFFHSSKKIKKKKWCCSYSMLMIVVAILLMNVSQFRFFHGFDFDFDLLSMIKFYLVYSLFDHQWVQYQNDPNSVANFFQAANKMKDTKLKYPKYFSNSYFKLTWSYKNPIFKTLDVFGTPSAISASANESLQV